MKRKRHDAKHHHRHHHHRHHGKSSRDSENKRQHSPDIDPITPSTGSNLYNYGRDTKALLPNEPELPLDAVGVASRGNNTNINEFDAIVDDAIKKSPAAAASGESARSDGLDDDEEEEKEMADLDIDEKTSSSDKQWGANLVLYHLQPIPSHPGAVAVAGFDSDEVGEGPAFIGNEECTSDVESCNSKLPVAHTVATGGVAVEYDPNAKPPFYRNRRLELYGFLGLIIFMAVIAVAVIVALTNNEDASPQEPTATAPPMTSLERSYREQFIVEVGEQVNEVGSAYDRAADWIMFEDPLNLPPDAPNLIQRYLLALFWFVTTRNGKKQWNSCNPPLENETDTCVFQEVGFNNAVVEYTVYRNVTSMTRWMAGTHECEWIGIFCDSSYNLIVLEVCKNCWKFRVCM